MRLLVGIDIGTTHCKAGIYTEDGTPVATASVPTPTVWEGEGSAHWRPAELWGAVVRVVRQAVGEAEAKGYAREAIVAVASSSPGEAGTLVDGAGQELCPFIAWYDPRTIPQRDRWAREMAPGELTERTGLPLDHIYTVNKLLWLREHMPEAWAKAKTWLVAAEWVGFRMSGTPFTTPSIASRSMVFDPRRSRWLKDLLDHCGVPGSLLPPVLESGTPVGPLLPEVAAELSLPPGAVVVAGGHDHLCAAFASGVTEAGGLLNSMGTAEVVLTLMDRLPASLNHPGVTLGRYVLPGRSYGMITLRASGFSLEWVRRELLTAAAGESKAGRYDALRRALERGRGAQSGLLFFPFLRGSLLPHNEPAAAAGFVGLRDHHTAEDAARAVLDGLTFETQAMREALEQMTGLRTPTLLAVGGGTNLDLWMQLKADVTGLTIEVPGAPEAGTLGLALLAGLGTGVYASPADAVAKTYRIARTYEPNPEVAGFYRELYAEYKALRETFIESGTRLQRLVDTYR